MKTSDNAMFRTLAAAAALAIGSSLLPTTALAFDYPEPGDFVQGSKTWAENCARCHNIRSANELRDDQWLTTVFHMRVRAGLTGQEARDVLTFLQTSNAAMPADTPVHATGAATSGLSGKQIFEQTCAACHGASGKGAFPGVPDFTRKDGRLSKPDDVLLEHIANGFQSPGSPMAMSPRGGNASLTDGDLRNVLKYLREAFGS